MPRPPPRRQGDRPQAPRCLVTGPCARAAGAARAGWRGTTPRARRGVAAPPRPQAPTSLPRPATQMTGDGGARAPPTRDGACIDGRTGAALGGRGGARGACRDRPPRPSMPWRWPAWPAATARPMGTRGGGLTGPRPHPSAGEHEGRGRPRGACRGAAPTRPPPQAVPIKTRECHQPHAPRRERHSTVHTVAGSAARRPCPRLVAMRGERATAARVWKPVCRLARMAVDEVRPVGHADWRCGSGDKDRTGRAF